MDNDIMPTADNTIVEIKRYLDEKGISYTSSATKSELLSLISGNDGSEKQQKEIPDVQVPQPEPVRQAPRYTKFELLSLITGYMHDYFFIALKKNRTYTYAEALQEVEIWKSSGIF